MACREQTAAQLRGMHWQEGGAGDGFLEEAALKSRICSQGVEGHWGRGNSTAEGSEVRKGD